MWNKEILSKFSREYLYSIYNETVDYDKAKGINGELLSLINTYFPEWETDDGKNALTVIKHDLFREIANRYFDN